MRRARSNRCGRRPGSSAAGVARALLDHLIGEARGRGWTALKLETGTNDAFAAARALYEGAGFRRCGVFEDYELTAFNQCYALELS